LTRTENATSSASSIVELAEAEKPLAFSGFDVTKILERGRLLLASGGSEYALDDRARDIKAATPEPTLV
jgi:hypothetical protein